MKLRPAFPFSPPSGLSDSARLVLMRREFDGWHAKEGSSSGSVGGTCGMRRGVSLPIGPGQGSQQSTDAQLIRDARAHSNAAIAAHDPAAMARLWKDDVHVVRSTGAQVAGREANQQRMAQQFAARLTRSTFDNLQPSTCTCHGRWRQSVGSGPPDGLSRTAPLTRPERTWRSGVGSKGRG